MPEEEIVIAGAGPCGCAAAVQCARLGLRPLILDRAGRAGGLVANAFEVENYPALPPLPGPDLAGLIAAHLDRFGLSVTRAQVSKIALEDRGLALETDAGTVRARAAIVAVGTAARGLDLPGADDLLEDLLFHEPNALLARNPAPDEVIVIGGGEAALDCALTLDRAGARVEIAVRGERLRAAGRLVDLVSRRRGISIGLKRRPIGLRREDGRAVLAFEGEDGPAEIDGCAALAAIGRESAAPALLGGLDAGQLEAVSTRVTGLFVAGDARSGSLGQVGTAVGDGLAAAMAAARLLRREDA